MEDRHQPVCQAILHDNPPGVYNSTIISDKKIGSDSSLQGSKNDNAFTPYSSTVYSRYSSKTSSYYGNRGLSSTHNDISFENKFKPLYLLDQEPKELNTVIKSIPDDLMDSLHTSFGSERLDTCLRPFNLSGNISNVPKALNWSVYSKPHPYPTEAYSDSFDITYEQTSCIDSTVGSTILFDCPPDLARKYFSYKKVSVYDEPYYTLKTDSPERPLNRWLVKAVPLGHQTLDSYETNKSISLLKQRSKCVSRDQITQLEFDNLNSARPSDELVVDQHTLREDDEFVWEEQKAHSDWLSSLRIAYKLMRKDPNVTNYQLRSVKHKLAMGLGKAKWKRSNYDTYSDSDCDNLTESTYSSITVTSYVSYLNEENISPTRNVLDNPCTGYNFLGDDPPIFDLDAHNNAPAGGEDFFSTDQPLETTSYDYLAGNNFMHIKSYGWLELFPRAKTHPLSHIPSYHQIYYEMRNDFIVFYYDNKFSIKSRVHLPCKIKRLGWFISKIDKNYFLKKVKNLSYNEAIYDRKLKLFHFGDSGSGASVKTLLSKESFTPIAAIKLNSYTKCETRNFGEAKGVYIEAQTIPLNRILWTRLKGGDEDYFTSADFEELDKLNLRRLNKTALKNIREMSDNDLDNFILTACCLSHMENEDFVSKVVSRKRATSIIEHLTNMSIPMFQHLSHFYNCPYLRELSLANIKFDADFDRYVFETSVKTRSLKLLDYRFRGITDDDIPIITEYISCEIEWLDLSNNDLKTGEGLSKLVEKGLIKYLSLDGNQLPNDIINEFKGNLREPTEQKNIHQDPFTTVFKDRFLDVLSFKAICSLPKVYSGRLATFQWGLVLLNRTKQLVMRSDYNKRIPENLLPLHYIYIELRGAYMIWFPHPLIKNKTQTFARSIFQRDYADNINITPQNVFYIMDAAVVKRAGFKWLKIKAINPFGCLDIENQPPKKPFYLYLRGPTDVVTNTWMTFMAKIISGQIYLQACEKYNVKPSRVIIDHCWQPWSQYLILYGYPLDYESLSRFMARLRRSLRLKYLNASNMKFDGLTEARPFYQVKLLQLDLSFNNFCMEDENNHENIIDFCTKDVIAKDFIMDSNPLGDNIGTAKLIHKAITSITANHIRFNYVGMGDRAGMHLCEIFEKSYESIGFINTIEFKGHNMTNPVLEKLLDFLKDRCPNLHYVDIVASITRHVSIHNDILQVEDTQIGSDYKSSMDPNVIGKWIYHKKIRKGKKTTRFKIQD